MAPLFKQKYPVAVIMDFDGTITELDVVDGILVQFAKTKRWIGVEAEWAQGAISSDECLRRQLSEVRVGRQELLQYLESVSLDPGFKGFKGLLDELQIPLAILSDGFDLCIGQILKNNSMEGIPVKSNSIRWAGGRLEPAFPHKVNSCGHCAHCKGHSLEENRPWVGHFVFIGDGLSDVCALAKADTVFAKGKLAEHCKKTDRPMISFEDLNDVSRELPRVLDRINYKAPGRVEAGPTGRG